MAKPAGTLPVDESSDGEKAQHGALPAVDDGISKVGPRELASEKAEHAKSLDEADDDGDKKESKGSIRDYFVSFDND